MMRKIKLLGGLLLAAALAACGGGGGNPGTNPNQPEPPAAVAATVDVFTSATELSSAANSSVTFTVVAKDSNNQAVPGQTVAFSASSGNLIGALPTPSTGAAGEPVTGVGLSPGSDRTNRQVTVTVTAGNATKSIVVPITGTTLALSGNGSLLLGGSAVYSVKALDSGGAPVSNATITLTSSLGNAVSPASVTTNTQGAATFTYTGTNAGNDTLRATGLGATTSVAVGISSDSFQFETPTASGSLAVGATQTATVRLLRNGSAISGQTVTFSTTRGSVAPNSAVTDAQGRASTVISSASAGAANLVAQVTSAQVTLPITFIATNPVAIKLQANPASVPPNTAGSALNQVTLQAVVRDAADNPVAGRVVNFTATADTSNGVISPPSATTDSSGTAQVQFTPGTLTTGNGQVQVVATVAGTALSSGATITVNAQALFISIAMNNEITNADPQTYQRDYSVYVTDANGAPVANRVVNLEVFPVVFGRGTMVQGATKWGWSYSVTCLNEDKNRNGILNAGEDVDGDGKLTPGLPLVVSPGSVTTDAAGFATFKMLYGENYAGWITAEITARTTVGGTESTSIHSETIGAATSDLSLDGTPAAIISPYGTSSSCTDPN